jgi:hypothetical protein
MGVRQRLHHCPGVYRDTIWIHASTGWLQSFHSEHNPRRCAFVVLRNAGAELFAETIGIAVSVERYCPIVRCPDLPAKLQFASEPQVVGIATGQPEPVGIAI